MKVSTSGGGIVASVGFIGFAIIIAILTAMCWWTDSNIDYWLTYSKGVETDCPFWLSCIATFVGNGVALVFNIGSEIAKLAM